MFTGIVEEIGTLAGISQGAAGYTLRIQGKIVLEDTRIGDSIAVNGTCLTVTSLDAASFTVDVAPESRARTNLASLRHGDPVNLERAVTPSTRLGGHMVQGHVDGVGHIRALQREAESLWVTLEASPEILRYVVPKGFICLDGVSLTVVDVSASQFRVMLIPHTQQAITLPRKQVGDAVNIEVDIVGKYVEKFVAGPLAARGVSWETLREHGFA